jgi:hypothetical protein
MVLHDFSLALFHTLREGATRLKEQERMDCGGHDHSLRRTPCPCRVSRVDLGTKGSPGRVLLCSVTPLFHLRTIAGSRRPIEDHQCVSPLYSRASLQGGVHALGIYCSDSCWCEV